MVHLDQAAAAVDGADVQPAPEREAPVALVGLALVHQPEADAALGHPAQRRARVADQHARHLGVAAPERHARHVGREVRRLYGGTSVAANRSSGSTRSRRSSRPPWTVRIAPGGEGGVAARPLPRRLLQHQHRAAASRAPREPRTGPRCRLPRRSRRRPSPPQYPLTAVTLPAHYRAVAGRPEDARHAVERTTAQPPGVWRTERQARWFFAAHLQGALGTGAGYVALLLLAYEQLGSAWGATAVLIADLAPAMLLGPLLGGLIDRHGRLALRDRRRADRRARLRRARLRPRRRARCSRWPCSPASAARCCAPRPARCCPRSSPPRP